jgi:membrane protein YqaA with SNARE-associated domain
MLSEKPNLDLASAKRIARGQINRVAESISERVARLPSQMPVKRLTWLRETENLYRQTYDEVLIGIASEKRRVFAVYLMPLAEEFEGWLSIEVAMASFKGARTIFVLAAVAEQTIARMMEGLKSVDAIEALRNELSEWNFIQLLQSMLLPMPQDVVYVATASGCFVAKWNAQRHSYIMTSWLPDRLATDHERTVLRRLRRDERLGAGPSLTDCI